METTRREIVVEPDMKASYVLIDSNGYLLDNAVDEMTPVVVCDCLMEDFAEGLRRLTLDKEKYEARYNLTAIFLHGIFSTYYFCK